MCGVGCGSVGLRNVVVRGAYGVANKVAGRVG